MAEVRQHGVDPARYAMVPPSGVLELGHARALLERPDRTPPLGHLTGEHSTGPAAGELGHGWAPPQAASPHPHTSLPVVQHHLETLLATTVRPESPTASRASFSTPMICSSVNRLLLMIPPVI